MKSKMLIDAAHPEETRVVVVDGGRVEEFDFESAHKKQLKGNIYLAKVTRVEPSLQAAFVDFGGNRHGFLAFNEIHPDYYQIPIADRQALLEEEAEEESRAQAAEEAEDDAAASGRNRRGQRGRRGRRGGKDEAATHAAKNGDAEGDSSPAEPDENGGETVRLEASALSHSVAEDAPPPPEDDAEDEAPARHVQDVETIDDEEDDDEGDDTDDQDDENGDDENPDEDSAGHANGESVAETGAAKQENGAAGAPVESVGSEDALEELPDRLRARRRRVYKIQEVIKRRQIILVQVVKEERGNKGAALTTYLSLAGRYTVLMPNTARGGGISRKITTAQDRKRLREIAGELDVPEGMGLIVRTAGAQRTKTEIKRDYDYLLRLWETVRDLTLRSSAPALVYEEGSLIKRSIRDLYNKDIEAVLVAGDEAYREAKDFMRMLMPSHAKNVQLYKEPEPLFIKYQVERHLAAMFSPKVVLKSGGYIVINQTEALVSIDVNSGRATREHNIEDTAFKTNLEASDEIARQLRLRDLAGLVVIDYIDMDERRNCRNVERRMKDALRNDRARIQVGRISHFGLLEMSRQRLRVGMLEGSTSPCAICQGTGIVRSTESVALDILRSIEDSLLTEGAAHVCATTSVEAALYILNHKRTHLRDLEGRYSIDVSVEADSTMHGAQFTLGRTAAADLPERESSVIHMDWAHHTETGTVTAPAVSDDAEDDDSEERVEREDSGEEQRDGGRKRRRRRGGRGRSGDGDGVAANGHARNSTEFRDGVAGDDAGGDEEADAEASDDTEPGSQRADGEAEDGARKPRRRGRRGGRRARGRKGNGDGVVQNAEGDGSSEYADAPHEHGDDAHAPGMRGEGLNADAWSDDGAHSAEHRSGTHIGADDEFHGNGFDRASEHAAEPATHAADALRPDHGGAPEHEGLTEDLKPEPAIAIDHAKDDAENASPRRGWWQRRS